MFEFAGFSGVYRLAPDGAVTLLTRDLGLPNGIAFDIGQRHLFVSNSEVRAFWR